MYFGHLADIMNTKGVTETITFKSTGKILYLVKNFQLNSFNTTFGFLVAVHVLGRTKVLSVKIVNGAVPFSSQPLKTSSKTPRFEPSSFQMHASIYQLFQ